jgi:hypothetical protein
MKDIQHPRKRKYTMKLSLLTLASIALTADALLTNPLGQGQPKVTARPTDIKKK